MFLGSAKIAIAFLESSGVLTKLAITAAVLVALGGAYAGWHHEVYESGYDAAIAAIAAEDSAALARATEKRSVWRDCRSRNGVWDQSTGRCS